MAAKNVKNLGVYETPDMIARFRTVARREGQTVARWCRDILRRKLREAENAKG